MCDNISVDVVYKCVTDNRQFVILISSPILSVSETRICVVVGDCRNLCRVDMIVTNSCCPVGLNLVVANYI